MAPESLSPIPKFFIFIWSFLYFMWVSTRQRIVGFANGPQLNDRPSPALGNTEAPSSDYTSLRLDHDEDRKREDKFVERKSPLNKEWLNLRFHDLEQRSIVKPKELEDGMSEPVITGKQGEENRILGSMLGLAIGDALGAHVEFRPHDYVVNNPVTDLGEGGTWGLQKGQFTDDTSMALCLANSLIVCQGFNLYDQLVRYKWWYRHGYMSSTGQCFDIGNATRESIEEFERRQTQFAQSNGLSINQIGSISDSELLHRFDAFYSKEGVAGNGSLMRLAPVPLFFFRDPPTAVEYAGRSGRTTHGDQKAIDACRYYAALIVAALRGELKHQLLADDFYTQHRTWFSGKDLHADIREIAQGSYKKVGGYDDGIRGSGYVVKTLEAALWAFWSTDSFEDGALAAVNLGDDTDTTAAIYGQLAGAYYGYVRLPEHWVKQIYAKKFLLTVSQWIKYEGYVWSSSVSPTASSL